MRRFMTIFGVIVAAMLAAPAMADVEDDYVKQCSNCHGKDGKGKTTMGGKLNIKDLTDPKVQAGFTDEKALQNISEGVLDPQTGKIRMPPRKNKLSVEQMKELVKFVRTFGNGG